MKRALVTGITGQDGAYLARHLLDAGYEVVGFAPRRSSDNLWRLRALNVLDAVELHQGDVTCYASTATAVRQHRPDEVYNLAAQSFVGASFDTPSSAMAINAGGVLNVLEAVRTHRPHARVYQASTSEMFGQADTVLNEQSPMVPRSPYGIAKLAGHHFVRHYREAYGLFACAGILFNHESPLRGEEFVTRKITLAAARIAHGKQERLVLGDVTARRDWGHAEDYVRAMHGMLQLRTARDFVIATGQAHSVQSVCDVAFRTLGFDWETCVDTQAPEHLRPTDINLLVGDASDAYELLGWEPTWTFERMIQQMAKEDYAKQGSTR